MKRPLLLFVFIISSAFLFAQEGYKNLDLFTRMKIEEGTFPKGDINVLVQGDLHKIKKAAEKFGAYYKYGYKDLAAVSVPLNKFDEFVTAEGILRFENVDMPVVPLADQAILLNNIAAVQAGDAPLNQPYKGDGVIVGIIDDGIDFRHADFMKDDSTTRIRYIWDQRYLPSSPNYSPAPYGYGRECNSGDINSGTCPHVEPANKSGHGTTVSGVAVGNGNALKNDSLAPTRYIGMAPNAEIIVVAINDQQNFLSRVLDGIDYIFKKADALGKPCVINVSYGTYIGPRDGLDLASLMTGYLLDERGGRAVVAAAGNAGNVNYHLSYEITSDTAFTWFRKTQNVNLYFSLFADTADFNNVQFAFAADNWSDTLNTFIKRTNFITLKGFYNINPGIVNVAGQDFPLTDSLGNDIGTISTTVTYNLGRYWLEVRIFPVNASHMWRFITTGSGRFDLWSSAGIMGTADMVESFTADTLINHPFADRVPGIAHYKYPDNKKTLVASIQCSDRVITVGNYINKTWWYPNYYNDTTKTELYGLYTQGEFNPESSRGPTRDNRQKPDISATGTFTVSTGNLNNIQLLINSGQGAKLGYRGLHHRNGKTSIASPCVAGAVALYLQKNPEAYWYEVKAAIITSAKRDTFTGNNLPDADWGYGKLNAFAAMQTNLTYGCTDTGAINYDATAQYDDGSCVAKRIGCMDPNALNYDSLANINDTCTYYIFGSAETLNRKHFIVVYPNPAKDIIHFQYDMEAVNAATIDIFNTMGIKITSLKINNSKGNIQLRTEKFANGIYFYTLNANNNIIAVNRFSVY
jgi:hypothetical protein